MTDEKQVKEIRITERHRVWLRALVQAIRDGGNSTDAYVSAFKVKNRDSARKMASKYKRDLEKTGILTDVMEIIGLDDVSLALKLKEGLDANRPLGKISDIISAGIKAAKGNRELAIDNTIDILEGLILFPDYQVRHKYLETSLKLKNKLPQSGTKTTIESGGDGSGFKIVVEEMDVASIAVDPADYIGEHAGEDS